MEKEILDADDVARILGQDPNVVENLFESGSLPGRRIADRWYVTSRQLLDFVEHGPKPVQHPAKRKPPAPYSQSRVNLADNSWECSACESRNPVERVECAVCKTPRMVPLMGYLPH